MKCYISFVLTVFSCIASGTLNSEYGECIGQSYLTQAYSNDNSYKVPCENNFVLLQDSNKKIFSGLKWQCVEYARRWLIDNKNVTFAQVKYAYNIWDLEYGKRVDTNEFIPILKFENRTSTVEPQVGDLLIYSGEIAITGHVAVVADVDYNSVTIAEQNYFNRPWDGIDYSRRLLLGKDEEGQYRIFDEALIGWVRFD